MTETNNTNHQKGSKASGNTATKKKGVAKKKPVIPKLNNLYRPKGMSLEAWQVALRKQQAQKEPFSISEVDARFNPGSYQVENAKTDKSYKVVYRGKESLWNFCSCFDFKTSQLGTCKHLEAVKLWVKAKRKKVHAEMPSYTSVYVDYKGPRRIRIRIGEDHREEFEALAKRYFDEEQTLRQSAIEQFASFLRRAKAIDAGFRVYDDAMDYVIEQREKLFRTDLIDGQYGDEALDNLLTVTLYPYQKEGIRFAVKAGKSIIADEMGLGKTIQAIAAAEILMREGLAESVLVVCPTSLKYQWKKEIERFTGGDTVDSDEQYVEDGRLCPKVVIVEGNQQRRKQLYKSRAPYKIVSYHAMCNDVRLQHGLSTEVLIMDEIQRLKNWDTLIAKAARQITSRYSILLSGTPLENKLEELYSTMELADQFCFGPYYQFRENHILLNPDTGAVAGYKNLNDVGRQASTRLIRRTKKGVELQLPKRSDQFILVPMTVMQRDMHAEFRWDLSMILRKYQKYHYMSEQDRKRMMLLLAQMRMVADSTFILEQDLKTRHDIKIAEVVNLLDNVIENGDDKVVIFSEWERMTRLVAMELEARGIRFEYLHGGVPSAQRGQLVENFRTLPESRIFLSTDAGSTGLNLQVANMLISLDLPWNPAVLEQRIARIYRLGQQQSVQIINLVSKGSIEEGMIGKLRFKTSMFEGVLDGGDDTVFVDADKFKKFMDDIENVMEHTPESSDSEQTSTDEEAEELGSSSAAETDEIASEEGNDFVDDDCIPDEEVSDTPSPDENYESEEVDTLSPDDNKDSEDSDSPASDENQNSEEDEETSANASPDSHTTPVDLPVPESDEDKRVTPRQPAPEQLISRGVSFLSGLAETLKSPEATQRLVDNITEVDPATGETSIKIPVASKETLASIFQLVGKLFWGMK